MAEFANDKYERVPFRMHPRVFAALGADLVTNDVVAVIELVKNSYDAFARNVWVRFFDDPSRGVYLEIEDDGTGMTREIIEDVWCLVATPYREKNPVAHKGDKIRRVAGEKGLGRLSAARLGESLTMLTQAPGAPCWEVRVNWSDISSGDDFSLSYAECRESAEKSPFNISGTRLQIYGLKERWDKERISDLAENLARLISPFSELGDFNIFLSGIEDNETEEIRIESPDFLSLPKYSITGSVDSKGNIEGRYRFNSFSENITREKEKKLSWEHIYDGIIDKSRYPYSAEEAHCGSFSFEIRAWDIAPDDTQEIAQRFGFQKSLVRKAIRAHKGISIYRDSILVLPKSDNARDWLGLDLRRISKVGTRLSTSQVVGYVAISAENNPRIEDTSDRERLASCLEVAEFEEIIMAIIALIEIERDSDKPDREKPMEELFEELSTDKLVAEINALSEEGADVSEAIPLLRVFSHSLTITRKKIQERFGYYSRLATIGTIAQLLVHEIRNRTTALGSFLDFFKSRFGPFRDENIEREYRCANNAVNALEKLADTFAPLASRSFKRGKRRSIIEVQIKEYFDMQRAEIEKKHVRYKIPVSETSVAVDPGELDSIIHNLVLNALYWLGDVPKENRELDISLVPINGDRVQVWIDDTGPGINEEDIEKVFWPGVTRKPGGIGMGLTVASELVAAYGGRLVTKHPGNKGGASFFFDLPLAK